MDDGSVVVWELGCLQTSSAKFWQAIGLPSVCSAAVASCGVCISVCSRVLCTCDDFDVSLSVWLVRRIRDGLCRPSNPPMDVVLVHWSG